MKIHIEVDDEVPEDFQSGITYLMARDYLATLSSIDNSIRSLLKYGDVYCCEDADIEEGEDTIKELKKKNRTLISKLEEIRSDIGEVL